MTREQLLRDVHLKQKYRELQSKARRATPGEETNQIAAEMAAVRAERLVLRPKRPRGRPRIHAVGHRASQAKGSAVQQARAARLRAQRKEAFAVLAAVQREFDDIASNGGPSR